MLENIMLKGIQIQVLKEILTQTLTHVITIYFVMLTVPGGSDGPSGVLICSENYITYKNLGDQPDIRCPIPRRRVSKHSILLMFLLQSSVMLLFECIYVI